MTTVQLTEAVTQSRLNLNSKTTKIKLNNYIMHMI